MSGVISVGDWIGNRFEVFDVHEGGMSLVYVVNDHMGFAGPKVLALKTLRHELLRSKIRVSRFAAECRIWTQLGEHPNIVRALSVEVIDHRPYAVLELVQGGDLSRWIGSPRLDLPRIVHFGLQFCKGMDHALRQGLHCHRDIKPGNLLVTEDGRLKITDFGLARVCEELVAVRAELPDGTIPLVQSDPGQLIRWTDARDQQMGMRIEPVSPTRESVAGTGKTGRAEAKPVEWPIARLEIEPDRSRLSVRPPGVPPQGEAYDLVDPDSPFVVESLPGANPPEEPGYDPRLTRLGARLGTGAYMAPEQFVDPKTVDVRADIYAFGVVLFEMITGKPPFDGRSHEALERQHARKTPGSVVPAIRGRHARIASSVDAIVQRCLAKNANDRYRTIGELRGALKAVFDTITRK